MPIFDYQCEACGHTFDALQKAGEGALRKCPECGKLKLRKLLAAPNFHLKGTGWYKTDFRDKGGQSNAKKGHTFDSGPAHSHDDKKDSGSKESSKDSGHSHSHSHSHSHGCHTHSHGGHTHSHGPGGHKH